MKTSVSSLDVVFDTIGGYTCSDPGESCSERAHDHDCSAGEAATNDRVKRVVDFPYSGLVLGTTYLLSGRNLWAPILAHGLADTFVVLNAEDLLKVPIQSDRESTIGGLVLHIFGSELRFVQRLKGEPLTDYRHLPSSHIDEEASYPTGITIYWLVPRFCEASQVH